MRLTAVALAAAVSGTLLVQSPATAAGPAVPNGTAGPATATSVTTATSVAAVSPTVATAADFGYEISFPRHVRRGGSIVFTVKVRNRKARGQHYVALVGDFPSRFRKIKVIAKPRSVKCSIKKRDLACLITSLDKGDSTTVKIRAWVGSRRGAATVRFGVLATKDTDASIGKLAKKVRLGIKARTRIL